MQSPLALITLSRYSRGMVLVTALVFLGLLLLLVLVHEWGHFFVARRAGCRVEEFGFGFPPKLFSIKRGGTVYSFNALPIGGFVRIEGEDMQTQDPPVTDFGSKSAGWRMAILAAGVAMNVVLAAVLLTIQAGIGFPTLVTDQVTDPRDVKTYVTEVASGSPAGAAGIKELDRVVLIDGRMNPTVEDIQHVVRDKAGQAVPVEIERQGQHQTLSLVPRVNPPEGEGALGVGLASTALQKVPWWKAPWVGMVRTEQMLVAIVGQFSEIVGRLVREGNVGGALTGPIGIAVYTTEATRLGASYVLEFAALISLNLALINILPLPALDGGRILFVLLEKLFRRRMPFKVERMTHAIGFAVLIGLMLLVTFKDIARFWS